MEKKVFKSLILLVLLYLFLGQLLLPKESKVHSAKCQKLNIDWEWIHSDGRKEKIEIPGSYDVPRGESMRIQAVLPEEIEQNTYLRIYCIRQDICVYIDGVLRSQYSTKDTRLFGTTSSHYFMLVDLSPEDQGKTIQMEVTSDSDYSGVLRAIYYGDRFGIWTQWLKEAGIEFVASIVLLLMGVLALVASIVLRFLYKKTIHLEYLSWCVILVATWLILNSVFRQVMFPNLSVASDVTFMVVSLMPMPFIIYYNGLQKERYRYVHRFAETLSFLVFAGGVFLEVTGIMDYSNFIKFILISCCICILCLFYTIFMDAFRHKIHEYKLPAIGMIGAGLAAFIQFVMYVTMEDSAVSGAIIVLGLLFLLTVCSISTLREVLRIEKEKQKAIDSSNMKAQFLANMSHEIRTPINAVLGMDEMILRESSEQAVLEYASDIQSAGKSLLSIVNDILDFSKVESGKMKLIPVKYSLDSLLNDCYNLVSMKAKEKEIPIEIELDPQLPSIYFGDEVRIRQILVNFLTNAVKYSKKGKITVRVCQAKENQTKPESLENVIWLEFSVIDQGIGIRKEDLPHLFSAFERMDEKKNRNIEGTGLGLALSKQLIDLMGGELKVESEYGTGSTFSAILPQEVRNHEPVGEFRIHTDVIHQKGNSFVAPDVKILVVDDVEMNRRVFLAQLKDTKIQIDEASNGSECLKKVQDKKYDLIFLDYMMPQMDGVETFHAMEEQKENQNRTTPVIMLTANAISGAKEEYLEAGFTDYLAKPVQGYQLEEMIRKYVKEEKLLSKEEYKGQEESVQQEQNWLTNLSFLDTKMGILYAAGSEEVYQSVLDMVVKSDLIEQLRNCYREQDWKNYRVVAHSIKGTLKSIGEETVSNEAKAHEFAARDEDIAYIHQSHEKLCKDYCELIQKIEKVLKNI